MMTELATVESTALTTNRDRLIVESGPEGASLDPDVSSWVHEAQRLFDEAERRLQTGAVLPALSSLAAVPPLHKLLLGRCSEMLDQASADDAPSVPNGLYL